MMSAILKRLLLAVPAVLILTAALFIGVTGISGSPAALMLGPDASYDAVLQLNNEYGFDRPLVIQYIDWLSKAVQGDFGRGFLTGESVAGAIAEALPVTFELALWSTLLATSFAIILNTNTIGRRVVIPIVTFVNILGITTPNFMIGISFIYLFSVVLGWFPSTGWVYWSEDPVGHIQSMVLPVLTMSAYYFSLYSIVYRTEYKDVNEKLYVHVARAKGLSDTRVAYKHVLPNAILPVITFVGISMGQMLGGAIVVETVFSVPGMGRQFVGSVLQHDFPVMLAIGCLMITMVIVMNLLADIAYTLANPQIRLD